eukprot:scaffold63_cov306-Pinguiococcus_pyrenoidosus.AAC.71
MTLLPFASSRKARAAFPTSSRHQVDYLDWEIGPTQPPKMGCTGPQYSSKNVCTTESILLPAPSPSLVQ